MNTWVYLGLLGVVFAYFAYSRGARAKNDPRFIDRQHPQKHWAQAAIGLYQGDVGDPGYWSAGKARDLLKSGWSVNTRDDLLELIGTYIAGESNVAFDKLRIIWLARLGRGTGWLDDAASWNYVFGAIADLQRNYASWPELFEAMKAGRVQWYGGPSQVPASAEKLSARGYSYASATFFNQVPYR